MSGRIEEVTITDTRPPDGPLVREPLIWRLGKVLVVIACYLVLEIVTKVIVIVQFAVAAMRGAPDQRLQRVGAMLANYMGETWRYGVFATNEAPWPFSRWPEGGVENGVKSDLDAC
jgi:hypothetical protein